jgi:hypothetical protein
MTAYEECLRARLIIVKCRDDVVQSASYAIMKLNDHLTLSSRYVGRDMILI